MATGLIRLKRLRECSKADARRSVQVGAKEARAEARAEELKRKLELTMQQKLRRLLAKLVSKAALELTMQQKLGSSFLSHRRGGKDAQAFKLERRRLELKS